MTLPAIPASLRLTVAMAAAIAMAGCSQSRIVTADPSLEAVAGASFAVGWTKLQPQAALLRLPDGRGRPVELRERRQARAVVQEIALPGPGGAGRNLLSIAVHGEAAQPGLYPGKPSEAGIRSELASAFPGRALRIVTQPRRNAYGPYGLAVSVGPDGLRCVYAWQWLDRDEQRAGETLAAAASWRARICRTSESLDDIAAALDQITLGAGPVDHAAPSPLRPAQPRALRKRLSSPAVARQGARQNGSAVAPPGLAPGGQRYLAAAPVVPLSPVGSRAALDLSLPAEAYRGPATRVVPPAQRLPQEARLPRSAVPAPD